MNIDAGDDDLCVLTAMIRNEKKREKKMTCVFLVNVLIVAGNQLVN